MVDVSQVAMCVSDLSTDQISSLSGSYISLITIEMLLAVVPFALFLLLEMYWKYEHLPECKGSTCSMAKQDRHSKSVFKSQRNGILVLGAFLLYWVQYRVTAMLVSLERISNQLKNLKPSE